MPVIESRNGMARGTRGRLGSVDHRRSITCATFALRKALSMEERVQALSGFSLRDIRKEASTMQVPDVMESMWQAEEPLGGVAPSRSASQVT